MLVWKNWLGLLLLSPLLVSCSSPGPVQETTLKNGLKVVVRQDHRAPVVVSQIWYRVGAIDEPEGITGISHVLEHMMFKGTKKHGPGEFSRIIAEHGGRENAFTGRDYTAYFQQLEKSRLYISFEMEADRMQNLLLDEEEVKKEVKVVMEERRLRTEDKPQALTFEKFMNTAYTRHTYKQPVIGWMEDLQRITLKDLQNWYQRWYTPANAILVVVGDVKPTEVFALADKYFGKILSHKVNPTKIPDEPVQKEARSIIVEAPAEVPYVIFGYHTRELGEDKNSWEAYALDVLAGVLDGGNSSRFTKELIREQQIAVSAGAGYSMVARAPTMFVFDGTPAKGHSVQELVAAIDKQIQRIINEKVSQEELDRVKAGVASSDVFSRDSVFYQAMGIGQLETVGLPHRLLDDYVTRIKAITAEQVQQVAKKYFRPENRTLAELKPLTMKNNNKKSSGGGHG